MNGDWVHSFSCSIDSMNLFSFQLPTEFQPVCQSDRPTFRACPPSSDLMLQKAREKWNAERERGKMSKERWPTPRPIPAVTEGKKQEIFTCAFLIANLCWTAACCSPLSGGEKRNEVRPSPCCKIKSICEFRLASVLVQACGFFLGGDQVSTRWTPP